MSEKTAGATPEAPKAEEKKPEVQKAPPKVYPKTQYMKDDAGYIYNGGCFEDTAHLSKASKVEVEEFLIANGKSPEEAKDFVEKFVA